MSFSDLVESWLPGTRRPTVSWSATLPSPAACAPPSGVVCDGLPSPAVCGGRGAGGEGHGKRRGSTLNFSHSMPSQPGRHGGNVGKGVRHLGGRGGSAKRCRRKGVALP